jgi:hypothetical protein
MRHLAGLRRRLAAAEDALADALAARKQAEEAFDAASDRFDAAGRALDAAREDRAQARQDTHTARQAYEPTSVTADPLQRRVTELSGWLAGLTSAAPRRQQRQQRTGGGTLLTFPRPGRHIRAMRELSSRARLAQRCLDKCSNRGMGVQRPEALSHQRTARWPSAQKTNSGALPTASPMTCSSAITADRRAVIQRATRRCRLVIAERAIGPDACLCSAAFGMNVRLCRDPRSRLSQITWRTCVAHHPTEDTVLVPLASSLCW